MKTSLVFGTAVAVQGSFWANWEVRGGKKCGYRARFVGGVRLDVMPYASAEIPPAGAPSGFDSAAMVGFRARRRAVVPLRSE